MAPLYLRIRKNALRRRLKRQQRKPQLLRRERLKKPNKHLNSNKKLKVKRVAVKKALPKEVPKRKRKETRSLSLKNLQRLRWTRENKITLLSDY